MSQTLEVLTDHIIAVLQDNDKIEYMSWGYDPKYIAIVEKQHYYYKSNSGYKLLFSLNLGSK